VETVFLIVVVGAVVVGTIVAIASGITGEGSPYDRIGKGGLSLDEPDRPRGPAPGTAAFRAEAETEIRQMVAAKSERREARGEAPLDIDAEVAALTRPPVLAHDDALKEEVRQLVVASNERRVRRGEEPLEVEAEVARQLRDLG